AASLGPIGQAADRVHHSRARLELLPEVLLLEPAHVGRRHYAVELDGDARPARQELGELPDLLLPLGGQRGASDLHRDRRRLDDPAAPARPPHPPPPPPWRPHP